MELLESLSNSFTKNGNLCLKKMNFKLFPLLTWQTPNRPTSQILKIKQKFVKKNGFNFASNRLVPRPRIWIGYEPCIPDFHFLVKISCPKVSLFIPFRGWWYLCRNTPYRFWPILNVITNVLELKVMS